jgi:hypothetical protein
MRISERTIAALGRVVTGDGGISPYRSGPNLVKFFNELGANDVYGSGFPSRWYYAEGKIRELNDTPILARLFESVLDPRDYIDTKFLVDTAAGHLNEYLQYDGFELVKHGKTYKVRELHGALVELELPSEGLSKLSHVFIEEQIKKCDLKVFEGDFAGAITNARSLLEAVLLEIEQELTHQSVVYDGDLPRLWRRVQGLLNLDPSRKDIADALRQVLGGLTTTILGIATLRNKISDAHATTYVASKRHAKLAVNAAKTIADFVIETFLEESGQAFDASDKIQGQQKAPRS